ANVLRSLSDHGAKRRNGRGVVVGALAVARKANDFSSGNVAQIQIVVFDISDPLFVGRGFFVLTGDGLRTALAIVFFKRTGPRRALDLERNGFVVVGEINGVEGKLGGRDLAL